MIGSCVANILLITTPLMIMSGSEFATLSRTVWKGEDQSILLTFEDPKDSYKVWPNAKCPFTNQTIRDYLRKTKAEDDFFVLGAYSCGSHNVFTYADGRALLERLLLLPENYDKDGIDRQNKKNIKQARFFECNYNNGQLQVRNLGQVSNDKEAEVMCIQNARSAFNRNNMHRACTWYQLVSHNQEMQPELSAFAEMCSQLATTHWLKDEHVSVISILEKLMLLDVRGPEKKIETAAQLGEAYYGIGDLESSKKWLLMSAENGSERSVANVGVIYREQGDIEQAIQWHTKGARKGSLLNMFNIFIDLYEQDHNYGLLNNELTQYANRMITLLNKQQGDDDTECYVLTWIKAYPGLEQIFIKHGSISLHKE